MWIIVGILLVFIIAIVLWLRISYSPLKSEFNRFFYQSLREQNRRKDILTKEELCNLPACIQKFYEVIGYIGKPRSYSFVMCSYNTDFLNGTRKIKINYFEYIFGPKPVHLAFIHSSIMGIPFQGLDSYFDGQGRMKGVVGKLIQIFKVQGPKMDRACLVTWLAEAIMLPVNFLENDIIWEEITKTHVKATFTHQSMTVSAEYKFNTKGELVEIYALGRGMTLDDGTIQEYPWSVYFDGYRQYGDYYLPAICQVVWHLEDHDLVYYDAKDSQFYFDLTIPITKE